MRAAGSPTASRLNYSTLRALPHKATLRFFFAETTHYVALGVRGRTLISIVHKETASVLVNLEAETTQYLLLPAACLRGADLTNADLTGADLSRADLSGSLLSGAVFRYADLIGAHLEGAEMRRADLDTADLTVADLRRANLNRANLRGANLYAATLDHANLEGACLIGADLSVVSLRCATLADAVYDSTTRWPDHFNPQVHGAVLIDSAVCATP